MTSGQDDREKMATVGYWGVRVATRLWWQQADGAVDNSMVVDAVGGDVIAFDERGLCVDAGWRASTEHAGERGVHGWPPPARQLSIVLGREQWVWLHSRLRRWSSSRGEDGELVRLIRQQLDLESRST